MSLHLNITYACDIIKLRQGFNVFEPPTPLWKAVVSKAPRGLMCLERFLLHVTRSTHLLCTLNTTPLPVTPLCYSCTRGGYDAPPAIHKTWHSMTPLRPCVLPLQGLSLEHT
jgi:hypothetical protein